MKQSMSQQVFKLYEQGPFADRLDPWAEDARYFHAIHDSMIDALLRMMKRPLFEMGYVAGRERSLQIAEGRMPDVFVSFLRTQKDKTQRLNYELAAAEALAPTGELLVEEPWLDALHIRTESGELVTVVEIISLGNKDRASERNEYKERRSRLFLEQGVNVVEIDLTRSTRRLVEPMEAEKTPYFVAIFIPGEFARIFRVYFGERLPRLAFPLRSEVLPIELQLAYAEAYQTNMIAQHIHNETSYSEDALPFPSLLTDEQRATALAAVHAWHEMLTRAAQNS
jgi:hypothetical protein